MPRLPLFAASFALILVAMPVHSSAQTPEEELHQLLAEAWEFNLREDPLEATRVGDHRFDDKLPRMRPADAERRLEARRGFLTRWEAIERDKLSRDDEMNYDIFGRLLKDRIAEAEFQIHLMPITNRSGFHVYFPELRRQAPLATVGDYENYIARLRAFKRYAEDHISLLRAGIEQGLTLPGIVLEGYREPIEAHIVDDPTRSVLYEPFVEFPEAIPEDERERLASLGRGAISEGVVPGYEAFLKFMQTEYVPASRTSIAASALPEGRAFYRHRVRRYTTLDLTPEQVHEIGLSEVKRIRREMEEVIERTDFEGDFGAFVNQLRTDPRFYPETAEELLKEVSFVLKKMDGKLPELFGRLPRMPYGIRQVPDYIAPRTTTAYYMLPSGDGTRAGFYYVNTYNLKSRPLYEVEALSLHEAVPGHHLQLALQQELELPPFRRFAGFTAFVEGWGLYAERLGLEAGFYEDPYSDFGRLSYEMWRACRLVVDTGVHYLGWTRQQAIDYMEEHTALSRHNIVAEVDRYIAWPGQALAYKVGELKIRDLRRMAEKRLGERFDVRAFHDVVLEAGSVPLEVLEDNVERWVEARLASK